MGAGRGGGISGIVHGRRAVFAAHGTDLRARASVFRRVLAAPPCRASARRAFAAPAAWLAVARPSPCRVSGLATRLPRRARLRHGRVRYCRAAPAVNRARRRRLKCARAATSTLRSRPRAPAHARRRRHRHRPRSTIDADLLVLAAQRARSSRAAACSTARTRALGGVLRRAVADERFRAKLGQTLVVHVRGDLRAQRVALVGLGARARTPPARALRVAAGARGARRRQRRRARALAFAWSSPTRATRDARACEVAAEGALLGSYRFDKYLTDERARRARRRRCILRPPDAVAATTAHAALARARATARAVARARDLVNEPAGYADADALADTAAAVGARRRRSPSRFSIAPRCAAARHGPVPRRRAGQHRGAALRSPRVDAARRAPARSCSSARAITFDSGGLSLKTNEGMLDMKTDMAGAAAVLAAVAAARRREARRRGARARGVHREHAVGQRRTSSATSFARSTARRSRSTTPTPRVG